MNQTETTSPDPSLGRRLRGSLRQSRIGIARAIIRAAFRAARASRRLYEPVDIGGRRYAGARESDVRWEAISNALKVFGVRNMLDVGCAEGWFLRRAAADMQIFAIGAEVSDRLMLGELARLYDDQDRTAIMRALMTPDDIRDLPKFDAVMCLSVVHRIIKAHGVKGGEDFVRALADRAEKVLIFEMGTSEEAGLAWSDVLPDMPEGQEAFVKGFLEKCGLKDVRLVGTSAAFHKDTERLLFTAVPR
jgi:hypothetical protein